MGIGRVYMQLHSFFWKEMSMLGDEMAKRSSTKFAISGILQKKTHVNK